MHISMKKIWHNLGGLPKKLKLWSNVVFLNLVALEKVKDRVRIVFISTVENETDI